jgi:hypothetical protein
MGLTSSGVVWRYIPCTQDSHTLFWSGLHQPRSQEGGLERKDDEEEQSRKGTRLLLVVLLHFAGRQRRTLTSVSTDRMRLCLLS